MPEIDPRLCGTLVFERAGMEGQWRERGGDYLLN